MEGNRNWGEDYFRHKQTNKQTTILEPNENISFLHQGIIFMSFVFYYIPLMAAFYGLYHTRTFSQSLLPALHIHRKKSWSERSAGSWQFHKRRNFSSSSTEPFFGIWWQLETFPAPRQKGFGRANQFCGDSISTRCTWSNSQHVLHIQHSSNSFPNLWRAFPSQNQLNQNLSIEKLGA